MVPPFGPKHSVKLSTPPPSQSAVAKSLVGFAANNAHISCPAAIADVQSSKEASGSPPLLHSVRLSTPPLSQSNVSKALPGLSIIN